jgi:hypothetical protein
MSGRHHETLSDERLRILHDECPSNDRLRMCCNLHEVRLMAGEILRQRDMIECQRDIIESLTDDLTGQNFNRRPREQWS